MKTLAVLQPWGWAIVSGLKSVENRSWRTDYRGPLLIHAGVKERLLHDADTMAWFRGRDPRVLKAEQDDSRPDDPGGYVLGAIIGIVELIGCLEAYNEAGLKRACAKAGLADWYAAQPIAPGKWAEGDFCWLLSKPVQFREPIDARGRVSLYDPEPAVRREVEKRLASRSKAKPAKRR